MNVWVILQYTEHDCGGAFNGVYAVAASEDLAAEILDSAPKAKSIVEGYRYEIVQEDVL